MNKYSKNDAKHFLKTNKFTFKTLMNKINETFADEIFFFNFEKIIKTDKK